MNDIEVKNLYNSAWAHWGAEAQVDMLIEEMSELTQALLKTRRRGGTFSASVYEELADVSICIDQMQTIIAKIGKEDQYLAVQEKKLVRLQERLMESVADKHPHLKDVTVGTPGANR